MLWENSPLMSLYQHELKESVQLAVLMINIQFTFLRTIQAMALKSGQTIEGSLNGRPTPIPPPSSSAPTTDPNAMDLLAFQRIETLLLLWPSQTCLLWMSRKLLHLPPWKPLLKVF
ncbi:uncharacterized protein VP01_5360g2 [Puccinia sorghi]|uniref:Uncharacterized protein n=1 Tax=Puccinia sorghi TaxID=27349 RepID=A0A0L6UK30_9BASI|nr:uncharacterized protein VP01_5360g2 [Puccinia sorghi]